MSDPNSSQAPDEPVPPLVIPPGDKAPPVAGKSISDPAASASPSNASATGSSTAEANIGEVKGPAFFGGELTVQYNYNLERQGRLRLTLGHFEVCERARLERESLLWIAAERQELVATLETRRLLLLCGEPELGKGSVARLLAAGACSNYCLSEMYFCHQSPTREMEIPFQEIFRGSRDYRGRVIVLKDALARDNTDIRRFFQGLDEFQLSSRTKELAQSEAFLIFTSDSERLGELELKLQGLGILKSLSPPPPDVLLEALHRLTEPVQQKDAEKREALRDLLKKEGERIARELKTVARAARFVRESLPDILSSKITLEQALRRASDLESWLLRDLPEDFDAWCYALALVLWHAAPLGESVTWMHFDRFRQLLASHLRHELRRSREKRAPLDLCREEELKRLARAEVQQPGFPEACTVAFSSGSDPARLWKVLLGPGRHLLTLLVPFLQRLTAAPEFYLRAIGARALGRIGELDPFAVTFPRLQNPGEGDVERRSRLLGQLLQGVLGSEDSEYRQACLRQLRRKLRSRSLGDVTLSLVSLREVGELDLTLAVREMRAAVDHWLFPRLADGKKLDDEKKLNRRFRELERLVEADGRLAGILRAAEEGNVWSVLKGMFSTADLEVLDALQYALVGLCLCREPISVISELQSWVIEESSDLGKTLAIIFSRPDGALDVLDRILVPVPEHEGNAAGGRECGVLLYELAFAGNDSGPILKDFMVAIHARLSSLPVPLRRGLRKRWLGSLKSWARQACKAEACRPAMVALLRELVRAEGMDVQRDVLSMLQGDRDFLEAGSDLEAIAVEAITGVLDSRK
jgi:hypothetical protein